MRIFSIILPFFYRVTISSALYPIRDDMSLSAPGPLNPRQDAIACINETSLAEASEEDLTAASSYFRSWLEGLAGDAQRLQEYLSHGHTFLSFFGHEHWGSSNFGCNLEHGCHQEPKCSEVKNFQLQHRRGRADEEIERDTNIIFLIYLQIYAQNNFFIALTDGMTSARESVGLISDKLTEDFTRQPDTAAGATCEMSGLIGGIIKTVVIAKLRREFFVLSVVTTTIQAGGDTFSAGTLAVPLGVSNLAVIGFNEYLAEIQSMNEIIVSTKQLHALHLQREQIEEKSKTPKNPNQPYIDQTYEIDVCGEAKHGSRSFTNSASMKRYVEHQFSEYRRYLSIIWGDFIRPNMTDPESVQRTTLWLGRVGNLMGLWVREKDALGSSNEILDRRMQAYMMSAAWRGSRCWLECQVGGDFHATCKGSDHRFCPNVNEICQAQCWTTFEVGNHIVPLYGHDKVGDWQETLPDILNSSRNSYFKHGNVLEPPGLNAGTTNVTELMDAYDTDTIQLPVCRSRNAVVRPVEASSKSFACSCGNWMSNETAGFLDTIQMGHKSLDYTKGWAAETFLHICPETLKDHPPLTQYLEFCALGIHEGRHSAQLGKDPLCDSIFHHVRQQRWTEREANIKFCEREYWEDAGVVLDTYGEYQGRCKGFLKCRGEMKGYIWDTDNHYE
ncbi:uncharacterized protein PAC_18337 [Phialocephala subalpina]|uniref:Uncharacterized protein n=1 Tax=Phialocephala subalpina TaxID=576137 RepID=A0A1L7XTW2_9HELO|nr:uncharacterized protein PAC_18337 [Phialocephala subalpina]